MLTARDKIWFSSPFAIPALRTLVFGLLAALIVIAAGAPSARAASSAETFVQQNIDNGLSILNDKSLSDMQRRDKFRAFILQLTDMKRIALFTLGQYRRGASQSELDPFVAAFTDYANAVYEVHLAKYKGQTMKVTGSVPRTPTDTIVNAEVLDPSIQQPITTAFRVLSDNGHEVVVDVQVEGVWLAIDQRDQFTAYLQRNGGNISALTNYLEKQAQQILAGAAQK